MPDLSHAQTLAILAIAILPAVLQAAIARQVHALWMVTAMAAAIFTVVTW